MSSQTVSVSEMKMEKKMEKNRVTEIATEIAAELSVKKQQVEVAIQLLDGGATVPFIARYRKEVTGSLDDIQLRELESRLTVLRDLHERREAILKSIMAQGLLTTELKDKLLATSTKSTLEDLYLPFKPKRFSKALLAREAGLEALADKLFNDPSIDPEKSATEFINYDKGFGDQKACLDGARQILMERFSEDAELVGKLRNWIWNNGFLQSSKLEKVQNKQAEKFRDYFEYHELIHKIPSHRALALLRGRNESILSISLMTDKSMLEDKNSESSCQKMVAEHFSITEGQRLADPWLASVVQWTWKVKLLTRIESEIFKRIKEQAEQEAISIFAKNLKDLLMAAPAGQRVVMGLDPALRTGVKVVVTDETGQLLSHTVIYPHAPQNQWSQSLRKLLTLSKMHKVSLISIGNGTGSRETERLVKELINEIPENKPEFMIVSEAGASVYSASLLASREFPDLDVTFRGAVSIARRIQDPLSELVKIDPKAIGVGQYQHDVNQRLLSKSLDDVVEDCVNAVGVDLNFASAEVLSKVAGLTHSIAENIVQYRNEQGSFDNRKQLLKVPRLGDKAFEQCAGFLRISNGSNPLDGSAVHPESYSIVEKIIEQASDRTVQSIIGDVDFLKQLDKEQLTSSEFGLITVKDVLNELEKPGRDPRPGFKTVSYKEGVESIKDLVEGMELEGVISNVTNFGAFVDIGVHQDGLVHISALSDGFVSDPRTIVKAGDIVKVWILEVDEQRKRISLSMKSTKKRAEKVKSGQVSPNLNKAKKKPVKKVESQEPSAFASLLSDALGSKN